MSEGKGDQVLVKWCLAVQHKTTLCGEKKAHRNIIYRFVQQFYDYRRMLQVFIAQRVWVKEEDRFCGSFKACWSLLPTMARCLNGCYTCMLQAAQNIKWWQYISIKELAKRITFTGHYIRNLELPANKVILWTP